MAPAAGAQHAVTMPTSATSSPSVDHPDNELYDRGCDLVEAAMGIRRIAADPEAARAVPAILGCLEAALHELGCAAPRLHQTSACALPVQGPAGAGPRLEPMVARMSQGFGNLQQALADAEGAAAAARALAARPLSAEPRRRLDRARRRSRPSDP